MAIHVGTSGFSYQDWRGHFYPEDVPDREMLSFYAQQFHTVEVNAIYYRLPGPATFSRMQKKVPPRCCARVTGVTAAVVVARGGLRALRLPVFDGEAAGVGAARS